MSQDIKKIISDQALSEGFSKVGICRPDAIPAAPERLQTYVSKQRHGSMNWMAERMNWRGNPAALWPEARSIIMLAETYTPDHDPNVIAAQKDRAAISVYAQNKDYHDIVKKRLKRLGRFMIDKFGGEIKVFVDTAPVMEKPLAAAAGLGWQGKHTNLLSRDLGNWFFIGAIFTTLDLPTDSPAQENCGNCTACLDACPTKAFPAPFQLDARRCISYLTIEHKGPVALELRENLGNKIYGCDDCLAACPWNKFASEASEIRYQAREDLLAPRLSELSQLDDTRFRAKFSGSPIKRIGVNRFLRNVVYAIGNSGDKSLLPYAQKHVSNADPVLADAARWAAHRLSQNL